MAQKGFWNIGKMRLLEDRGSLPRGDGALLREQHAMHKESFLCSWLREDVEGRVKERERFVLGGFPLDHLLDFPLLSRNLCRDSVRFH